MPKIINVPISLQINLSNHGLAFPVSNTYLLNVVEEESELYETTALNEIYSTPLGETFQELLFKYIDKSGMDDINVYKSAFIDRKLFSKIRSNKNYHPSFGTVTLLSLAMKLDLEHYIRLLASAFYSLPGNTYVGITLRYCFSNRIYDVIKANNLVFTVAGKEIKDL